MTQVLRSMLADELNLDEAYVYMANSKRVPATVWLMALYHWRTRIYIALLYLAPSVYSLHSV